MSAECISPLPKVKNLQVRRVDQTRYPMIAVASLSAVPQSRRTPLLKNNSKRIPVTTRGTHTPTSAKHPSSTSTFLATDRLWSVYLQSSRMNDQGAVQPNHFLSAPIGRMILIGRHLQLQDFEHQDILLKCIISVRKMRIASKM